MDIKWIMDMIYGFREWLCCGFPVRFQEAAFIGVDVGVYKAWLKDG